MSNQGNQNANHIDNSDIFYVSDVGSVSDVPTTGTVEQTLKTFTLGSNSIRNNGERYTVKGWFRTAANANSKTASIAFGSVKFSTTGNFNAQLIYLELELTRTFGGQAIKFTSIVRPDQVGAAAVVEHALVEASLNLLANNDVKLLGTTPTSSGDLTAIVMTGKKE